MKNIPKYKQELIKALKKVSTDKDFILNAGSAAGQNEQYTKIQESTDNGAEKSDY